MTQASRLTQNLELLDALEVTRASSSGLLTDPVDLEEQLRALCEQQAIEADDAEIKQAVQVYQAEKRESSPGSASASSVPAIRNATGTSKFTQWPRPASKDEWIRLKSDISKRAQYQRTFVRGNLIGGALAMGILLPALHFFVSVPWREAYGLLIGAIGVSLVLNTWLRLRGKAYQELVAMTKPWRTKVSEKQSMSSAALAALAEMPHDMLRLKQWLTIPAAAEALGALAESQVPILEHDAYHLDELLDAERSFQAADPGAWDRTLKALSPQAPQPLGGWVRQRQLDPLTDTWSTHAFIESVEPLTLGSPYEGTQVLVMVVDESSRGGMTIGWQVAQGDFEACSHINVRFDQGPVQQLPVELIGDIGLLRVLTPGPFREQMREAQFLRVELPFYANGNHVVAFNVSGLDPVVSAEVKAASVKAVQLESWLEGLRTEPKGQQVAANAATLQSWLHRQN